MNDVYKMDDHATVKGTRASVFMYFEAIIIYWPLYFNAFNDFTEIGPDAVIFGTFVTYHMMFLPVFSSEKTAIFRILFGLNDDMVENMT